MEQFSKLSLGGATTGAPMHEEIVKICLVEVTQLRTKAVEGRLALFTKKQSEKHHISASHADVRLWISTKFCMVIEVVRAIILGPIRFWVPSIVFPLGVVENLAENAPTALYCL